MKVYTRSGDDGRTSLFSGGRVAKDDHRIEAYGSVDELNAVVGVLLSESLPEEVQGRLIGVQEALFSIGGALADPKVRVTHDSHVWDSRGLEAWIDSLDSELNPLQSFILPGGCRAAAVAHVARAVCRRSERRVCTLCEVGEKVPNGILPYLNRLSDAFFVLARYLNALQGISETEWKP